MAITFRTTCARRSASVGRATDAQRSLFSDRLYRGKYHKGQSFTRRVLVSEWIRHQDGVFALRRRAEQRHRAADQLLDGTHVLDAGCWQLGERARAARALAPSLEGFPHRLELAT